MSKKLNIDFYKIRMPDQRSLSFEAILQQVIQLPTKERIQKVYQSPVFLHQASDSWQNHCWEGEVIRLRMDNLPVKGNLSGNIEEFVFDDDEGIGEPTAFLYHPPTGVLLLQANQVGVTPTIFIKYFEIITNLAADSIIIEPVIQASAMQRLAKMNSISKFDIQVAGLDKMHIFRNQGYGVQEIIDLTNSFDALSVNMNLSVGRKRQKSLSLDTVKDTALAFLRISSQAKQEIRRIVIKGSTSENDRILVDLLKDRMRESIDVKRKRTISYLERKQVIQASWQKREQEIFSMFGSN